MSMTPLYKPNAPYLLRHAKLLVVEGVDGVGKTTLLERLNALLSDECELITYKEPSERHQQFTKRFAAIQERIEDSTAEKDYRRAYTDRILRMVEDLEKYDEPNKVILADRFIYSTAVYQATNLSRYRHLQKQVAALGIGKAHHTVCVNPSPANVKRFYRILEERFSKRDRSDTLVPIDEYLRRVRMYNSITQDEPRVLRLSPFTEKGVLRSVNNTIVTIAQWLKDNP